MKGKYFVCVVLVLILLGSIVTAQEEYDGPGIEPVTVEEVQDMGDDSPVILRGRIESVLGDEKYLFTDETGSIVIEIENGLWKEVSINQNDTVEIIGEIDKEGPRIEIAAITIKKI
ncbi:MAG: NirD/YgiW/YdeI family stress tolerance protein [Treponema sp.]|jgi:uncharacterized protein (TIGR00156 family)|nr:NirD/YgiW/YdeI family stress tolerance protein [Treponema sp.]